MVGTFGKALLTDHLPRRKHTKRSDYDLMKRTNVHEIVKKGWIYDQNKDKIINDNVSFEYLLAQEKGINTYTKVEDAQCTAAQQWWLENKVPCAKDGMKNLKRIMPKIKRKSGG